MALVRMSETQSSGMTAYLILTHSQGSGWFSKQDVRFSIPWGACRRAEMAVAEMLRPSRAESMGQN